MRSQICRGCNKGVNLKNIAVLTCGRSDFSIYLPLLKYLQGRDNVRLQIIAFGTHTSHYHGYTLTQIRDEGFDDIVDIDATLSDDKPESIAVSMGLTIIRLAEIWRNCQFDWVFCLGDRYEMFAAVSSAIHFNLRIAHFHGGEKTLGAVDNSFRHAISAMSNYHFTSCEAHEARVKRIVEDEVSDKVFNVGSLSLQSVASEPLLSAAEFMRKFNIDLSKPTVLVTYHPETIALDVNRQNVSVLLSVFDSLNEQVLITLPNNDSMGAAVREAFVEYSKSNDRVYVYDFLGTKGYYSAMKQCSFMLGNSSSGIIEAASFGCYVVNVGDRQKGRACGGNVFHVPCEKEKILNTVEKINSLDKYEGDNFYYQKNTLENIISQLQLD